MLIPRKYRRFSLVLISTRSSPPIKTELTVKTESTFKTESTLKTESSIPTDDNVQHLPVNNNTPSTSVSVPPKHEKHPHDNDEYKFRNKDFLDNHNLADNDIYNPHNSFANIEPYNNENGIQHNDKVVNNEVNGKHTSNSTPLISITGIMKVLFFFDYESTYTNFCALFFC